MIIRRWTIRAMLWLAPLLAWPASLASADEAPKATASWWLPENAAEHGGRIDALFTLIFVVTVAVMILVFVFLVYLLIKYRYQAGRRVVYIHGNHRLEVLWTLTPAVLLVVMGVLSLRVWADVSLSPPDSSRDDVTEVEVLAQQFQFNVRYPGQDRRFGTPDDLYTFDTAHEFKSINNGLITVPVDRPVKIHLMSKDVLHSLFLPHMRMKRDAVPGLRGVIYFTPTRTGLFDIACAELCGPQHYSMSGRLQVLSQEEYDEWLEGQFAEVAEQLGEPLDEQEMEEVSEDPADEEGGEPAQEDEPADSEAAEPPSEEDPQDAPSTQTAPAAGDSTG